tara:strand:- start:1162 stop:1518 length:357 start_codon:yes stop_codon:yes gene_type:complete
MIRFKNNVLPVWIQWDGDEEYFERAKNTIIEDIRLNGFKHYTGLVDITDEPTAAEKGWDGSAPKQEKESKSKPDLTSGTNTKKASNKKNSGLPKGEFISENEVKTPSTDFDTNTKTAS